MKAVTIAAAMAIVWVPAMAQSFDSSSSSASSVSGNEAEVTVTGPDGYPCTLHVTSKQHRIMMVWADPACKVIDVNPKQEAVK